MGKTISEMLEEKRREREEEERKRQEEANRILESLHNKKDQTAEENNSLGEWIPGNREQNVGGFSGGLQYVGQRFLNDIVSSAEGLVDYTVGGLAKLFGGRAGEKYAEELMENTWYDYEAADRKYNPNWLMKGVGDVAGGLGQGVFSIGTSALVTLATGGAGLAPTIAKGIGVAADVGIDYLSSAGRAVASAVQDEGADNKGLTDDKWVGGSLSGLMEASLGQIVPAAGKLGNKVLGETSYEMGSEIVESVTKRITKNLTNSSAGKEILGEMAGEAIEEGLSAYLEPYIKRGTYDSDASNASVGDVLYSALIGGITGGITSGTVKGVETTVNAVTNTKRGNEIASDTKKLNGLLQNAEIIKNYESERHTGSSVFGAVVEQYNKVVASLETTGGVAATVDQKKMLGELDAYVAQAVLQPTLVESAKNVVYNADAYAESLNNFYKKTGSDAVVTAADLTAGLDTSGDARSFVKSVSTALKNNGALRGVVLNNALGQMEMDTRAYANSIYGGTSISAVASQENINRFVETADEDTIKSVEATLGVDMRTVTPEVLAESIMRWRDSGAAAVYEGGFKDVQDAVNTLEFIDDLPSEYDLSPKELESIIAGGNVQTSRIKEGVTRFTHGDTDIAIIKHGDEYRIYDYKSGKVSRVLTRSELSGIVRQLRGGGKTIEVIGRVAEGARFGADAQNIDAMALESIPEYKSLNESEKLTIRETIRRAIANGVSSEDAVLFGKISAKSGMNIVALNDADYRAQLGEGSDAKFDGRNTVYINADADRSSVFSGLLGHEMWHKIFKSGRGKKLFMKAYKEMPEDKRAEVEKRYADEMGELGYGEETSKKIAKEEVAAAYAEELFNNPEVWDYVLSEEPSLKDRVISFFKGANKKYSFEPGMTAAAKKWLKEYKRLFNEVSAYNKGRNAAENAVASEGVKRIEKIGKLEDGKLTLLGGNNAAENTLLRTLNAENAQESSSSTAGGPPSPILGKAKDSGERYSYSSIAYSFFGDKTVKIEDFESGSYKSTEGYKKYVDQCLSNVRQTTGRFNESKARKEIESSIDGIVRVAVAMKKAGYDILDNRAKRETKDSKNRLLFSSLEPNSDYFTSSDISTICDKRINFAQIYDDIVRKEESLGVPTDKRFFNNVDNYFIIHKIMADKGLTQPCRQCYVESMRKNLAPMAKAFLKLVQETNPNNTANDQLFSKGKPKPNNAKLRENLLKTIETEEYDITADKLTVEMLTTEDGLAQLKLQAPLIYEAFNSFYGQSKPKMPKSATPFRFGELTALLTDDKGNIKKGLIEKIKSTGGFRLQSYSDFQIQNFADVLQVIFEAGTLGLPGHAYTKVPAFLDATKGTNLKRNISIFMYNDNGEWRIDKNDSFPYDLDKIYDIVNGDKQGNTSVIAVVQNEVMAAYVMANDNIGYFIPFHKSGMKMDTVRDTVVKEGGREIKGYSGIKDHTRQQTEVWAKTTSEHKAYTKVTKGIDIYEFWDFNNADNLSKEGLIEKNVKRYIDACEEAGYLPKFREYLTNNSKILSNVLSYAKELGFVSQNATVGDISFEYKGYKIPYGYYKCLGDYGMFKPNGEAAPAKVLSLKNYNFDEAVKYFEDSETLRRNEILQQIANGEERERYRNSNMTTAEIADEIQAKRGEVVNTVVKRNKADDGTRYALKKEDPLKAARSDADEHVALVKELMKETKTEEEKIELSRYISELKGMDEKLYDRTALLQTYEANKKTANDLFAKVKESAEYKEYSSEKDKAKRKELQKEYQSTEAYKEYLKEKRRIDAENSALEERLELLDNEISRRDSVLLEVSALAPVRDLVQRAYKIGKTEGATAKVTPGVIKKRMAQMLHSKMFSYSEAKAAIDQIANKYGIDNYLDRSDLARQLWTQLNSTENRGEQKAAITNMADEIIKRQFKQKVKGLKNERALVRRVQKYKKRIVFDEWERRNIEKYYSNEADNIFSIWEYDGNKNVTPKKISDVLWDAGQIPKYSHYADFEYSAPSDRSDMFYQLLDEFETHEERVTDIEGSAKSEKRDIIDILWRVFEDGGKETYKAKYNEEVGHRKIYRTIENRVMAFENLEKGRFKNATEGGGDLFVNTLDQIPKMLYKGSLYPGRANKVLEGLNKWYVKENNMLSYVNDSNPGLFDKDIKEILENLTADEKRMKYSYEELQAIDSVLQYFYNFVEHYNKIYRKGLWVDALPVAEGWLAKAQKQETSAKMPLEVLFKNKYVKGFGDTESVMKLCDGYEDGIFTDTFDQLREGYINSKVLEMEVLENFEEFIAKKENKGFADSLYKNTAEINGVKIPRYALIGYYLSLQREHARAGLAYNGFFVPSADGKRLIQVPSFSKIEYVYDENKSQEQNRRDEITMINRFAENELASLRKKLTKQEKEYISIIESTFAACKGIKEDADVKMYGYTNCADEYYYPIRRYATGMGATLDVYTDMMGVDRFTNASFNKNVTKGAKQALYIEDPAAVLSRHVKNLCLYANVSPVVDNFNRLWNLDVASNANLPTSLKTFYDQSERTWKENRQSVGFKYLQSLITDIMNGGKHDLGFGAKLMSYLRGSYATFALGGVTAGNPKVLMTQLSSIVSSTALLRNSSILKSVAISGEDVDKYCSLAKLRNRDDSAVRAQSVMDNISEKQKFWTAGISWMDRQVVKRLFAACQAEAESTLGLKVGTEANKVEAGKILHNVILETQQNALITERTESMRSGSEFMKSLSMFRGDSIKNFGRLIDASGELLYLKAQLDGATQEERAVLNSRIKEAGKKFGKSLGSIMTNAALLVGISHLFENLLAEDDDEEKPWYLEFIVDLGSNILGGLPVISQAFSKIHEGYGLEGFEYSVVNDILDALVKLTNLTKDFATGELTADKLAKNFDFIIDSIGQVLHTPTRNIRKVLLGLTKRFSPEMGYRIEDFFNNKNYGADLEAAIEAGDDLMALTIIELAMKNRLGSGLSDKAIKEMARLTEFLKDKSTILPAAVGDSLTVNGETRELTASEVRAVREKYSEVIEQLNKFIEGDFYKKLSDEDKAAAVKKIYALYKDLAYDTVLGTEKDKKAMILSKVVPAESLVLWEVAGVIGGDKDENGKTISGSQKENVIEAIMAEKLSLEEKLLLIGMRGNSLNGGDIEGMTGYEARTKLYEYIKGLDVSDADRDALLEYCGFKDRDGNGTIDEPLPSDVNNSYKSDLFDAIESGDTKGAGEIANLAVRENLGKDIAKDTANEIVRLAGLGKNVLPSAIQDSITVNGKERELTASEYKAAMKKYSVAAAEVDKLIKSDIYKSLNDDQKASALKSVFDMFKDIAYDTTLGTDKDRKAVVLSKAVDTSALVIWDVAGAIDADRDENGYTIDGSRKENVINAIWGEKLSYEEKLLLIGASGYSINGGDLGDVTGYEARMDLYEYISDLKGIEEGERLELYKYCGFADESGNVREPLQADVQTTYEKDLKAAIESDNAKRAVEIISLAMRESFGKDVDNDTIGELLRLTVMGKDVLTSAVSDKISINGKTRELTVEEYKAVFEKSSIASSEIQKFIKSDVYKTLNDDQRASVVNSVYDMFKDIAYDTTIGTEKNAKATAMYKVLEPDALVLWKAVGTYEADRDENGKSISGSKKAKIVNAIWASGYTDEEKLLLIGMNGYKIDDDDIPGVTGYQAQMALYNYIASLEGITEEERLTIYKECGYTIDNGVAVEPTEKSSSSSSSSSSKKTSGSTVKRIGWKLGGGTMVGSLIGKDYTKKIVKLGKIKN